MARTLMTIGLIGMALAVTSCKNPDDRFAQAVSAFAAP